MMPLMVYGMLSLLGWLWLPITARLLPAAPDRGLGITRYLVLFVGGWLAWWLAVAGLGHASFWLALAAVVLVGGASWAIGDRQWARGREVGPINGRVLLAVELVGIAFYGGVLLFRGWSADITTFEKYTNLAIVNSILLVPQVPPQNAWFGGQPLNYYYLGHWLLAWLCRITGLPANDLVMYATPLVAAFCAQGCVTIAAAVAGRRWLVWALMAAYVLLLCGSFNEVVYGLGNWRHEWQQPLFQSSIVQPIVDDLAPRGNLFEFPGMALLQAEIHAHVLGLPLLVLLLALLTRLYAIDAPRVGVLWFAACIVIIGSAYPINSWQYPVMLLLWLAAFGARWLQQRNWRGLLLAAVGGVVGGVLAFLPFWLTFETFAPPMPADSPLRAVPLVPAALLVWSPVGTSLWGLLLSLGLPLLLAGLPALLLVRGAGWRWLLVGALVGLVSAFYRPIGWVLVPLAAVGLWHWWQGERAASMGGLLLACAALLVLGCEYVMIPDHTFSRSNTLFKFYIQAWVLLAIAAPLLLAAVLQRAAIGQLAIGTGQWARYSTTTVALCMVVLLLAGLVFPILRGRQWIRYHGDRWWGLDSMAQVAYYHPDEAAAIAWLRHNRAAAACWKPLLRQTMASTRACAHHTFRL
ncbi:MAG: hypothetical protein HC876_21300 [Chloroflexaceae bacterium]|nr:hypothetical protein [Chloroflexaceae bacterium]